MALPDWAKVSEQPYGGNSDRVPRGRKLSRIFTVLNISNLTIDVHDIVRHQHPWNSLA